MDELSSESRGADETVQKAFELYSNGDLDGAVLAAEEGLKSSSDPVGLNLVVGMAKRRQGRQRQACEALDAALKIDPKRSDIWTVLGMCRRDLSEREASAEALKTALSLSPGNSKAMYQLAVVRQEMGDFQDAIAQFKKYTGTKAGADHSLAWSLMGVAYRNLGDMKNSVDAIRKAISLNPDDIPTRNALVISHYLAGDESAAIIEGRKALVMKDHLASERFLSLGISNELKFSPGVFNVSDRTKNIISFSLWGDDPVYTHGAIVNAQMAPNIYPSWKCRFYCDETVPGKIRDELVRLGSEVQLVTDPELKELKTIWRFLVADDDKADRFICRDTDSRLNVQEAVAVDDWIKSGQPFHVMRDHIYHMEVMLAGLWGGVSRALPSVRKLANTALGYSRNRWNDQEFLRDVIWPMIRNNACIHDSVYQFRGAKDFPAQCRLPDKIHVGGAIKKMPEWPVENWPINQKTE